MRRQQRRNSFLDTRKESVVDMERNEEYWSYERKYRMK